MNIRKEDAEILFECMKLVAEAAIEDEEYKHSDYGGMAMRQAEKQVIQRLIHQPDESIKEFESEPNQSDT